MPKLSVSFLTDISSSQRSWFNHVEKWGINLGSAVLEQRSLYFLINISLSISNAFFKYELRATTLDPFLYLIMIYGQT